MLAFRQNGALNAVAPYVVDFNREEHAGGIDYLDPLPHSSAQRASQMAGVTADDDRPRTLSLNKEGRQSVEAPAYIALKVS